MAKEQHEYISMKLNRETVRTIAFALDRLDRDITCQGIDNVVFGTEYKGSVVPVVVSSLSECFTMYDSMFDSMKETEIVND
jgi:hypothetical protein